MTAQQSPYYEPVLVTFGEISVTQTRILVPSGSYPLEGANWTVVDNTRTRERIPPYAIVLAVVFAFACLLGLLFLLIRERKTEGWVTITVQNRDVYFVQQIPVYASQQVFHLRAQIDHVRGLTAAATRNSGGHQYPALPPAGQAPPTMMATPPPAAPAMPAPTPMPGGFAPQTGGIAAGWQPGAGGGRASTPLGSKYQLDEKIGAGGFGDVWRATSLADRATVAVKMLRATDDVVERFLRERRAMLAVRGDHVVKLRDLVVEGDTLALVSDFVSGGDLRRRLGAHGPYGPFEAADLLRQVLDGLASVHDAGIVHRDVKPENVLIDERGRLLLTDFGIARIDGMNTVTASGMIMGTFAYMAPELATSGNPSPASDLYAAGIVGYELLTGHAPHTGQNLIAVLKAHANDPVARPPGIPDPVWAVLDALLAKEPDQRPASAADARDRLHAALQRPPQIPQTSIAPAPPDNAPRYDLHTPPPDNNTRR
ncbi:MAG: serine/threonine-protein kinase [Mycobacteriales bacterium]